MSDSRQIGLGCLVASCTIADGDSIELLVGNDSSQAHCDTVVNLCCTDTVSMGSESLSRVLPEKIKAEPPKRKGRNFQFAVLGLVLMGIVCAAFSFGLFTQRMKFEVVKFTGSDYDVCNQIESLTLRDPAVESTLIEFALTEPDGLKAYESEKKLFEFRRAELGACKVDSASVKKLENGDIHIPLKASNMIGATAQIRGKATMIDGGSFSSWDTASLQFDSNHVKLYQGKWHVVLTPEIEFTFSGDYQTLKARYVPEKVGIAISGKDRYGKNNINWFYKIKPEQLQLVNGQLLYNPNDTISETVLSLYIEYRLGEDIDPELSVFDSYLWKYSIYSDEIYRDEQGFWYLVRKPEDLNIRNGNAYITLEPDRFYAEGQGSLQPQSFACKHRLEALIRELDADNLAYGRKELPLLIGAIDESELFSNNLLACEALAAFARAERRAFISATSPDSIFKKAFYRMFAHRNMAFYDYSGRVYNYMSVEKRFPLEQRNKAQAWFEGIAERSGVPTFVEIVRSDEFRKCIATPPTKDEDLRDWRLIGAMKKAIGEFGAPGIDAMVASLEREIRFRTERKGYYDDADSIGLIIGLFEDDLSSQKWKLVEIAKWSDYNPIVRAPSVYSALQLDYVGADQIANLIILACRQDEEKVREQIHALKPDGNMAKELKRRLSWLKNSI